MSAKFCMTADGSKQGGACDLNKTCVAPLSCNQVTGLCDPFTTPGNHKDPCYQDAQCNINKYPGLHCTENDGKTQGTCDCTNASGTLTLCSDTEVCVSGTPPPPIPWPDAAFPGATDAQKRLFTGACSAPASKWYSDLKGNCAAGQLATTGGDAGGTAFCFTDKTWDKSKANGTNFCLA